MYRDRQILVLTVALAFSLLLIVVTGLLYWQVQGQESELDEKSIALAQNIGQLKLLDEQLTLSAKLVAAARGPGYEDLYKSRYDEAAREYENVVEETLELFPESGAKQQFQTTRRR